MSQNILSTILLTSSDVHQIVEKVGFDQLMDELIIRFEQSLINFNAEQIQIPIRSGFHYDTKSTANGLIEWMPLHEKGKEVVLKVVGYHPDNPKTTKIPTILSTISSYDTSNGHLLSIVDGVLLTSLRTGAASAVASSFLASPHSSTLGLIGCGAQSITQAHAISRKFDIQKIIIYDADSKSMHSFAERIAPLQLKAEIKIADRVEQVVEQADILCTATSVGVQKGPLFGDIETKKHLHINAVGSDFPGKFEIPLTLLKKSFVCPDFLDQALLEGECQRLDSSEIHADLIEVAKNQSKFVEQKSKRTVFDSTGWSLEDQIISNLFVEKAKKLGVGQYVEIESILEDAKNPYHFLIPKKMHLELAPLMEKNDQTFSANQDNSTSLKFD